MSLTILSVAYPFAAVSPAAVGGAEQVLSQLDAALTSAGHRSLVVACEGSRTSGMLMAASLPGGIVDNAARRKVHAEYRALIDQALRRWPVDVVHMHGIDFHAYLPEPGVPVLVTLHLPPSWYPPEALHPDRPRTYLHCVSHSQRDACPPDAPLLEVIENGVPLPERAVQPKGRYAIALGRICPEKGFHIALDAAKRAGVPMVLAGQVFPYEAHRRYYDEQIAPRLDSARCCIGPIGPNRKRQFLSAARCLLVPSLAPETSSLVAMEALACGTPVVAFPSGALPHIVEHGRTGFLVHDEGEMADAIPAASDLDPEVCRETARRRFSVDGMVRRYFDVYRRLSLPREERASAPEANASVEAWDAA